MNPDKLAELVLLEVARQCDAINDRPKPPAWKTWQVHGDTADRELGPRYSPTWFGDAGATEARRVRLLRSIYRLAAAGLLTIAKSEGGRLERVQLTKLGRDAATELMNVTTEQRGHDHAERNRCNDRRQLRQSVNKC